MQGGLPGGGCLLGRGVLSWSPTAGDDRKKRGEDVCGCRDFAGVDDCDFRDEWPRRRLEDGEDMVCMGNCYFLGFLVKV